MSNGPYDHSNLYDDLQKIFTPAGASRSNSVVPPPDNIPYPSNPGAFTQSQQQQQQQRQQYYAQDPSLNFGYPDVTLSAFSEQPYPHFSSGTVPSSFVSDPNTSRLSGHLAADTDQFQRVPYIRSNSSLSVNPTPVSVPPTAIPPPARDSYANRAAKATGALARFGKTIIGANSSSSDYDTEKGRDYAEGFSISSGRASDPPSRDNSITGSYTGYPSYGHHPIQRSLSTAPLSSRPSLSRGNSASVVTQFPSSVSPRNVRPIETKRKDFRYYTRNEILAMGPSATEHAVAIAGKDFFQILRIDNDSATAAQDIRGSQDSKDRDFDKLHNVTDLSWGRQDYRHTIALATSGGQILVYNIDKQSPKPVTRINDSNRTINSIVFHPYYGSNLISASGDGCVKIWDLRQNRKKPAVSFLKSGDVAREIQCSPFDNNKYAAIYDSGVVMRWDARYPRLVDRRINAHTGSGLSLDWHPEYDYIVTGGMDKQIQIWHMNSDKRNPELVIHNPASVAKVRWQHDILNSTASSKYGVLNTDIACCNFSMYDFGIYVWNPRRPYIPHYILQPHTKAVSDVFWRSQSTLWSISRDKTFCQNELKPNDMAIKNLNSQAFSWSQNNTISFVAQDRYEELYEKDPGYHLPPGAGDTNLATAAIAAAAAQEDERRRGGSASSAPAGAGANSSATGSRKALPSVPAPPSTAQSQAIYSLSFPGTSSSESFKFCGERYFYYDCTPSLNALRKWPLDGDADINSTTGIRAVQICENNALAAAEAGKFRTSQIWFMLQEVIGQERVDFLKQHQHSLLHHGNSTGSALQPFASKILESLKSAEVSPLALPVDESNLKVARDFSLDRLRKGSTVSSATSGLRNSETQQHTTVATTIGTSTTITASAGSGANIGSTLMQQQSSLAPILSSEDSSSRENDSKSGIISSDESESSVQKGWVPQSFERADKGKWKANDSLSGAMHKKGSSENSNDFNFQLDQLSLTEKDQRKQQGQRSKNNGKSASSPRMPYITNSESMGDLTAMYSSKNDPKFRRFTRRDTHEGLGLPSSLDQSSSTRKQQLTTYDSNQSDSESINDSSSSQDDEDKANEFQEKIRSLSRVRTNSSNNRTIEQYDIDRATLAYASYESDTAPEKPASQDSKITQKAHEERPKLGSEGSAVMDAKKSKTSNSAKDSNDDPDISSESSASSGEDFHTRSSFRDNSFNSSLSFSGSDRPLSSSESELGSGSRSRSRSRSVSESDSQSGSRSGSYESDDDDDDSYEAEPVRRITSNTTNKTISSMISRPSLRHRRLSQGSHYSGYSKHSLYSTTQRRVLSQGLANAGHNGAYSHSHGSEGIRKQRSHQHHHHHHQHQHPHYPHAHPLSRSHSHRRHSKASKAGAATPSDVLQATAATALTKLYRVYQRSLQHPWKAENMIAQAAWYAVAQGDVQLAATLGMLFLRDYPGAFHHKNSEGFEFEFQDLLGTNTNGKASGQNYYNHVEDAFDEAAEQEVKKEGEAVVEEWVHTYLQDLRKQEQHVVAAEIIKLSPFESVSDRGRIETSLDGVCHRCAAPLTENGATTKEEHKKMEEQCVSLEQRLPQLAEHMQQYIGEEEDEEDEDGVDTDKKLMAEIVARYIHQEQDYELLHSSLPEDAAHGDKQKSPRHHHSWHSLLHSAPPRDEPQVEFWYCGSCQTLLDGCAYCRIPVKGLAVSFFECGHKIHAQCLQDWACECGDIPDPLEPKKNNEDTIDPMGPSFPSLGRSAAAVTPVPVSAAAPPTPPGVGISRRSTAMANNGAGRTGPAPSAGSGPQMHQNFQRSYSATYMPSSWFSQARQQTATPAPTPVPTPQQQQTSPTMSSQRLHSLQAPPAQPSSASTPWPFKRAFRPTLECPTGCGAVIVV